MDWEMFEELMEAEDHAYLFIYDQKFNDTLRFIASLPEAGTIK